MAPILAVGIILPWFITLKYISVVSAYIYLVIFTVIEVYALTAMANLLVKFDNGTNYTYFTIRDDQYVYSIEVAYKANEVKRSYHDIRNMVEMAKLINRPHKQEFPALKYIWEADVFRLP